MEKDKDLDSVREGSLSFVRGATSLMAFLLCAEEWFQQLMETRRGSAAEAATVSLRDDVEVTATTTLATTTAAAPEDRMDDTLDRMDVEQGNAREPAMRGRVQEEARGGGRGGSGSGEGSGGGSGEQRGADEETEVADVVLAIPPSEMWV